MPQQASNMGNQAYLPRTKAMVSIIAYATFIAFAHHVPYTRPGMGSIRDTKGCSSSTKALTPACKHSLFKVAVPAMLQRSFLENCGVLVSYALC